MPPAPQLAPTLTSPTYVWLKDPESTYGAVSQTARIKHFRSLVARNDYFQFVGHLPLHRAHLMAYGSSNVQFFLEDAPMIHLVACFGGSRQVRTPHGEVVSTPGDAALLPPGNREALGESSTAVISLVPQELASAAAAMAGQRDGNIGNGRRWHTFRPLAWGGKSPVARKIHGLVQSIDHCAAVDPALPAKLALDDVLHRLAAALLLPDLLQVAPEDGERLRTREGKSAVDDLIAYIEAHLDQPLRLSDLEARSHYSRRALQYAFREKLNSTPKQWIRQQRLKAALAQLQSPDAPSVQAVALNCGYLTLSHFCSDFKREFGLLASEVRRKPL